MRLLEAVLGVLFTILFCAGLVALGGFLGILPGQSTAQMKKDMACPICPRRITALHMCRLLQDEAKKNGDVDWEDTDGHR